ncbi:MAG: hypothetical protein HY367_03975 [Candidatus Aenigmarchaeota archaeon]|nr:hypothetical protein [Candidatus Aenigmarchaeota archaeon]
MTTMQWKYSEEGYIATWEYERLYIVGLHGLLGTPLEWIGDLYDEGAVEFAPVKKEPGRDFLAGFSYRPPVDVTLVRKNNGDSSIVACGLDKMESKKLVSGIALKSGMAYHKPSKTFREDIEESLIIEALTYELCGNISCHVEKDVEDVFGAVKYAHFLVHYSGLAEDGAYRAAGKRFGILHINDIMAK